MWEKRIGAAGAIISGGGAFVVLAVCLDRVSEHAAQWMQAGGTVLAFVGLLYVHWNEGRRRFNERRERAALAADLIRREMGLLEGNANIFLQLSSGLAGSNFLNFLDSFRDTLKHPRSDKFLQLLATAHFSAARQAAFAMDVLAKVWQNRDRVSGAEADELEANGDFDFREFAVRNIRRAADAAKRAADKLADAAEED